MNKLTKDQLNMINRLQSFFKEKMGGWVHGDPCVLNGIEDVYCEDCIEDNTYSDSMYKKAIRVPKVYDWKNPERGLWRMVDWCKYHGKIMPSGDLWIWKIPYFEFHAPIFIDDPFTALLKILCEQEGA